MKSWTSSHRGAAGQTFLERHPHMTGGAIGVATLPLHAVVPHAASVTLAALLLALIAGVYFGFAVLARDGGLLVVELAVALGFVVLACAGLLASQWWIPAAYMLHAGWDLLHRRDPLSRLVPTWYVPFCVKVDLVAGAGLTTLWLLRT